MCIRDSIDLGGSDRLAILLDPYSSAFKKFENDAYLVMENGNLVLMATASKDNNYARLADTFNSRAGAELLWNLPGDLAADSILKKVDDAGGALTLSLIHILDMEVDMLDRRGLLFSIIYLIRVISKNRLANGL